MRFTGTRSVHCFFVRTLALVGLAWPSTVCAYSPSEGNVSATLGAYVYQTNFNLPPPALKPSSNTDFAIILNGDLNDKGQLEIAIYHMYKKYYRDVGHRFVGEETELIDITMGYRRWLSSWFSLGLAFSSAYSLGGPSMFYNDFAPQAGIDTSARDTTEYGLVLSTQVDLFTIGRMTAVINGLYSLSFTAKPNERADHYGAVIGLRYFIQEKQIVERPKGSIPQVPQSIEPSTTDESSSE